MAKTTYTAKLNYYDSSYGWGGNNLIYQGAWSGTGTRTGVMYFSGLAGLKGKIINSVTMTVTNTPSGYNASKTAHFYRSAKQGGIDTKLNAGHRTGAEIGTWAANFHQYANPTLSKSLDFLKARIATGDDTYCIYATSQTDYLAWSAVTLVVDWQEPATQPVLSKTSATLGTDSVTITTTATSSAYRHTLRYAVGSAKGTIAENVATSAEWSPPLTLANYITAAASGSITIYCDTYSGTTLLGTKSISLTAKVPASVVPTAGTLSASVVDDTSGTGLFVVGMGKARLTLSGYSGVYGSTISKVTITGGGWSANGDTLNTGVLQQGGEITFTATVTDSRGRSAMTFVQIAVEDYSKPAIGALSVYRCDASGKRDNNGTYFAVDISASVFPLPGNTMQITAEYKLADDPYFGQEYQLVNDTQNVIGGDINPRRTYDIEITLRDAYNTITTPIKIRSRFRALDIRGTIGVAIGKFAEIANAFEVAFKSIFYGDVDIHGDLTLTESGWRPYYKPGDSITMRWTGAGFVSAGSANCYYTMTLDKPILPGTNVTLSGGYVFRQDGNYTRGSAASSYIQPTSHTVNVVGNSFLQITAAFASTENVKNNAETGIDWNGTITFS